MDCRSCFPSARGRSTRALFDRSGTHRSCSAHCLCSSRSSGRAGGGCALCDPASKVRVGAMKRTSMVARGAAQPDSATMAENHCVRGDVGRGAPGGRDCARDEAGSGGSSPETGVRATLRGSRSRRRSLGSDRCAGRAARWRAGDMLRAATTMIHAPTMSRMARHDAGDLAHGAGAMRRGSARVGMIGGAR